MYVAPNQNPYHYYKTFRNCHFPDKMWTVVVTPSSEAIGISYRKLSVTVALTVSLREKDIHRYVSLE